MRNLRSTVAALALGLILGGATASLAVIPNPTGPTDPSQVVSVVLGQVNTYLGNLITKWSGATSELQFSGSQSWAANSNVAVTVTSLGPQCASTTISKWLVVVDNTGTEGVMPWYRCTH